MDRLFQSAQRGDVEKLHQLLAENPLILQQVHLACPESPLHLSSAVGHLAFAREILKLQPEFVRELNHEGYSPMHLASAKGHVEIVKEIIRFDPELCRLEGRDGRTPFHFAVLKGWVGITSEMLASNEGCIEDVTVQKETALHLAVKNCQFGSLQVMMNWIRQMKKEKILNMKDEHGNTILHLAVWKKHRKVLESLLGDSPTTLEVNAINTSGLTALDLLLIFPSEAGDRELMEILYSAGALKAQDLTLHITTTSSTSQSNHDLPGGINSSSNLLEYFKFHDGRDSPSDVRTTLLVIAVLVATATYQVGINPPGGQWQDDQAGHVAGTSILGTKDLVSYILLVTFNSIGFCVSLFMISALTSKFPLQAELQICLFALYATYNTAVIGMSPHSTKIFTNVFTQAMSSVVPWLGCWLCKYRVGERIAGSFRRTS